MTPAERLSGRQPTDTDIEAIARHTLDGLPSPFPLSEQDVRKPLSDNGWIITDFGEATLVAAGATMGALFDAVGVPPRDRAELACWRVRASRA